MINIPLLCKILKFIKFKSKKYLKRKHKDGKGKKRIRDLREVREKRRKEERKGKRERGGEKLKYFRLQTLSLFNYWFEHKIHISVLRKTKDLSI